MSEDSTIPRGARGAIEDPMFGAEDCDSAIRFSHDPETGAVVAQLVPNGGNTWTTRVLPEIGFTIRGRLANEVVLDVEAFEHFTVDGDTLYQKGGADYRPEPVESIEEAERFLRGSVKWDGCSNLSFDEESRGVCLHFCGKERAMAIGLLLGALYDLAAEMIEAYESDGWIDPVLSERESCVRELERLRAVCTDGTRTDEARIEALDCGIAAIRERE